MVRDAETREIIQDMSGDEPLRPLPGGNGGWGNKHSCHPTRQTPQFAKAGRPGKGRTVLLGLKLLADVGLVGFPNVGKVHPAVRGPKARPKIANYHFTTLFPNLGVVFVEEGGLLCHGGHPPPASLRAPAKGPAWAMTFSGTLTAAACSSTWWTCPVPKRRDPVEDLRPSPPSCGEYSPELAGRKMIVAANKTDILADRTPCWTSSRPTWRPRACAF